MNDEQELLRRLRQAVIDGSKERSVAEARAAIEAGIDPLTLLNEGLVDGADEIGASFQEGKIFLPELMLSGIPLNTIIGKASEVDADIIACSALLTTSMPYMRDLVGVLEATGLRERFKVMVGGASITPALAEEMRADGTADDAIGAVALARQLLRD